MVKKTNKLVTSAMLIALGTAIAFVCEYIPFLNLPFGGTITFASLLPLVLIGYLYGPAWGFGSAFVFSLLQMLIGFRTVAGLFTPDSDSFMGVGIAFGVILLDYLLAFTAVGISSFFRKMRSPAGALAVGSLVGLLATYAFHTLSGWLFYGAWAEWFFTDTVVGELPVAKWILETFSGSGLAAVYSLVYNGCYMIPEILITVVCAIAVSTIPAIRERGKNKA